MQVSHNIEKGVLSQPIEINVDWLALTIRIPLEIDWNTIEPPDNWRFRVLGGTAVWNVRVLVLTADGEKIATILCSPRNTQIFEPNVALIEIANEWLYHGIGWQGILEKLSINLSFEVLGISRADVCCDFTPTETQRHIIFGLRTKEYQVGGKENGAGFNSVNPSSKYKGILADWTLDRNIPHQQSWGHKTSDIKWKLYYKSRELLVDGDKPYIRDAWERCGLDVKDVWRLECSMHYPHRLLLAGRPVSYEVFNAEWPSLMRSMYQSRFKVQFITGKADKSKEPFVSFIPALDEVCADVRCRPPLGSKTRYGRITLLRHLIKSLNDEQVLLNDTAREGVMWLVDNLVQEDNLDEYFERITTLPVADWIEDVRVDAYSRVAPCKSAVLI